MARVVLLEQAELDILQIWLETDARWGERQADKYITDIRDAFVRLEMFPQSGTLRTDVEPSIDYRFAPSGSHRIWYRIEGETVIVDRILHTSQDPVENI